MLITMSFRANPEMVEITNSQYKTAEPHRVKVYKRLTLIIQW